MENSDEYMRRAANLFSGIPSIIEQGKRPVSGYVVTGSQMSAKKNRMLNDPDANTDYDAIYEIEENDEFGTGLKAIGDIEIVLRKEVAQRTSYTRGEQVSTGGRPVRLDSMDEDEVMDSIVNADGPKSESNIADAMINLLTSYVNRTTPNASESRKFNKKTNTIEKSHSQYEAQILGGFSISEIEGIHFPFSKVEKISESENIEDALSDVVSINDIINAGCRVDVAEKILNKIKSGNIETPGTKALKSYRAAMKIRKSYESRGIDYVRFSHKKGWNIDNPQTYDVRAKRNENVEDVIKRVIKSEITSMLKKLIAEEKSRHGVI